MTAAPESTTEHRLSPSTLRVRRHRERRREGLRLVTVEVPEPAIEAAVARGLLKPEDHAEAWAVVQGCYAAQLSDAALDGLISDGVIMRDQRADAAAILRSIGSWLERTALSAH